MASEKPVNFDWLGARLACSVRQMFEELRESVKQDVETWNAHLQDGADRNRFKYTDRGNSIRIYLDSPYDDTSVSVVFSMTRSTIDILDGTNGQKLFFAAIGLNDEGDCKYIVDGKEYDSWQIRRKALERVFFG